MGIRGLKSFIDNNSDLKQRHRLHSTYLVIDGNNLIYSLYWSSSSSTKDYIYGGDYTRFATTCQQFFKALQKCSIRALVVLDGGIDPSQQKIRKLKERFRQNLEEAKQISKGNIYYDKIIPTLSKPVFMEMLACLGVDHIQASFEADQCIAKIAEQLKCPVLSNDSDFFVYDLSFGVISIDSLMTSLIVRTYSDENDSTVEYKYLDCDLFTIENLIQYFPGLKREILPLFSTLMGNDWVESSVFDNIFNAIPNVWSNTRNKSKGLHVGKRHLRMIKLLDWLRYKTVDESIDFLINFLKKNSRNNALDLLQMSLESYSNDISSGHSYELSAHSLDLVQLAKSLPNRDETLPKWFVDEFHTSQLSTTYMNAIQMKCEFFNPRVEDFSLPSTYSCALEIRQYLYALVRRSDEDMTTITAYDRNGTQMVVNQIEPLLYTPNGILLPNLYELRNISIDERRVIFADIISINESLLEKLKSVLICDNAVVGYENNEINGAVFLICIIRYWIKKCFHEIWIEFIYSLLTSIMFCGHIGSYNKIKFLLFEKNQNKESIDNLSKYNCRPIHNMAKLYEPRVVHFYNEFQDCLKMIRCLNFLFDHPFPMGTPFFSLNGPFIYNLTVELSSRKDPVLYCLQLFGRQSLAANIFPSLLDIVLDGFDENKFVRCLDVTNRKTHIRSQRIRSKDNRVKTNRDQNLENKFSVLKIDKN